MTQTTNPETVPPQPLSMEGFPRICKRDGSVLDFDATRISRAIAKAGAVTAEFDENTARRLCLKVLALLPVAASDAVPTLEEVQDLVEEVLLASPFRKTAKAYILYRDQHAKLREIREGRASRKVGFRKLRPGACETRG